MFKSVNFNLIHSCNWKCDYCNLNKIDNRQFDVKKAKTTFKILRPYINEKTIIPFGGGEPGLVSKDRLDILFEEYRNVNLCTNGLFIKKGYLKEYYNKITGVRFHTVPKIDKKFENFYDRKITQVFLVHHRNIDLIMNFLNENIECKFDMSFYGIRSQNFDDFLLTKGDCEKIFKIIDKNPQNFYAYTRKKLEFLYMQFSDKEHKDKICKSCIKYPLEPIFDLIENKFSVCCNFFAKGAYKYDINDENVNKLDNGSLYFDDDIVCKNCSNISDVNSFSENILKYKF